MVSIMIIMIAEDCSTFDEISCGDKHMEALVLADEATAMLLSISITHNRKLLIIPH